MRKPLSPFIAALVVFVAGSGEYWIRYTVAHDICARVQYRNMRQANDYVYGR
jgi:hypothetical protein